MKGEQPGVLTQHAETLNPATLREYTKKLATFST